MRLKYLLLIFLFGCESDLPFVQAIRSDIQFETEHDLTKIWFYDSQRGYVLTRQGTIISTTDGAEWQETEVMKGAVSLNSIAFSDKNTGYVVGQSDIGNYLFRTVDGGNTWEEEPIYFDIKCIEAASPNVLYACSDNEVYKKVGDEYWRSLSGYEFSRENLLDISFSNEQQGTLITERALYGTEDGGDTWTKQIDFYDLSMTDADINGDQGVILDRYGKFYTLVDGNTTWNYHANKLPSQTRYRTVALAGNEQLYVAGDYDLLYSTDKGESWTSYKNADGSSLSFADLHFVDKQNGYGVSNGTIYKLFNSEAQ